MEPEVLPSFRRFTYKARLLRKRTDLRGAVTVYVSLSDQVRERQLHTVYESQQRSRNGHVPEDQPAAGTEDPAAAFQEIQRMRIMMEAHGADRRIETVIFKGKVFTVPFRE